MGSKNKNVAHRSRIIDSFLAKFKKVVNSATVPDKTPTESPMTSLMNRAAVLAPQAPQQTVSHSQPFRTPVSSALLSGQSIYSTDSRRSSDAASLSSVHSNTDSVRSTADSVRTGGRSAGSMDDSDDSAAGNSVSSTNSRVNMGVCEEGTETRMKKRDAKDFVFGKIIGEGSFSSVYIAMDVATKNEIAIKVCVKSHIVKERKVREVTREREILAFLSNHTCKTAPFFVKLYSSFQDQQRLYFELTYAKNGELFSHIQKVGSFDMKCTKFYAGEILHALEHMHSLGIVHRDLKPENILLDADMHILITDFGCAKILTKKDDPSCSKETAGRRNSFVGTAQYISPELLTDEGDCSRACDLWAFGAIVYQMVAGLPPFRSKTEWLIFQKIKNLDYEFPEGFNPVARDLVTRLLVLDPRQRLGASDGDRYTSIREHPFFQGVQFESLYKQTPPAIYPYLPGCSANEDLRSNYRVPDNLEPGFDDRQITRMLGLELGSLSPEPIERRQRSLLGLSTLTPNEIDRRLAEQRAADPRWHAVCEENLILKRGHVNKRRGLFSRRRMLLLTLGPHLYYADPDTMTLKGEIPWSSELRVEVKNFKIFFVHTPDRTYYLQDPEGFALDWCTAIDEMRVHTYGKKDEKVT